MARNAITTSPTPTPDPALANIAGTDDPKALARIAKALEKAKAREAAKAEKKAQRAAEKLLRNKDAIEARAKKRAEREAARAEKREAKAKERREKDEARKVKVAARDAQVDRELFFRALAPHVSRDPSRYAINQIKVDARFGYSTNGHVLVKLPTPEGVPPGMYARIDEDEDAKQIERRGITAEELAARPAFAGWRMVPEADAGRFPDVEQVIPSNLLDESIEVARPEALAVLPEASQLNLRIGDRHHGAPIRAVLGLKPPVGNTVHVVLDDGENNPAFKVIEVPKDLHAFGVNPSYLYGTAKSLGLLVPRERKGKKETPHLEPFKMYAVLGHHAPMVLHARTATEDGRRGLAVVMPMRV